MPFLPEIQNAALRGGDPQRQIDAMIQQLNEWAGLISNESLTNVYKDNAGTNRIIIGVLPDGDTGIVMSKEGVNVNDVFD